MAASLSAPAGSVTRCYKRRHIGRDAGKKTERESTLSSCNDPYVSLPWKSILNPRRKMMQTAI